MSAANITGIGGGFGVLPPVCFETFRSLCPEVAIFYQGYQVNVCGIASIIFSVKDNSAVADVVSQGGRIAGKGNKRYGALKIGSLSLIDRLDTCGVSSIYMQNAKPMVYVPFPF